ALGERVAIEAVVVRREEEGDPAVAELGGERDVLRPLGAEEDRDPLAQGVDRRLERLAEPGAVRIGQRIVRTVAGDRALAGEDVAHDTDVLARARQWLGERLAIPA